MSDDLDAALESIGADFDNLDLNLDGLDSSEFGGLEAVKSISEKERGATLDDSDLSELSKIVRDSSSSSATAANAADSDGGDLAAIDSILAEANDTYAEIPGDLKRRPKPVRVCYHSPCPFWCFIWSCPIFECRQLQQVRRRQRRRSNRVIQLTVTFRRISRSEKRRPPKPTKRR
jgi:hypothetical protein